MTRPRPGDHWKAQGSMGTLGIEIVLCVLLGGYAGHWLGGRAGHPDVGLWIGGAFGVGAAIKAIGRTLREVKRRADEEEAREGNPAPEFPYPEPRPPAESSPVDHGPSDKL